jgi:uncharacterized protein
MATIEVVKGTNGQFRFRIRANNGEIIATGESYKQKQKVMQTLRSLKSAVNGKVVDLTAPKPAAKPPAKKTAAKANRKTTGKAKTAAKKAPVKPAARKAAPTPKTKPSGTRPRTTTPVAPKRSITAGRMEADQATVMEGSNIDPQTETEVDQTPEIDEAGDTTGIV